MKQCHEQAGERNIYWKELFLLSLLVSPRASGVSLFWALSLTARCYLSRFGSPRMGFDFGRTIHPRMFTAEPVRRLIGDSAVQFTPHHIFEWGAKTAVRTRGWLYELPSGSRNHILELREKMCYRRRDNCMSDIALSTKLHRNQTHGSPARRAAAAAAERSPYPRTAYSTCSLVPVP